MALNRKRIRERVWNNANSVVYPEVSEIYRIVEDDVCSWNVLKKLMDSLTESVKKDHPEYIDLELDFSHSDDWLEVAIYGIKLESDADFNKRKAQYDKAKVTAAKKRKEKKKIEARLREELEENKEKEEKKEYERLAKKYGNGRKTTVGL